MPSAPDSDCSHRQYKVFVFLSICFLLSHSHTKSRGFLCFPADSNSSIDEWFPVSGSVLPIPSPASVAFFPFVLPPEPDPSRQYSPADLPADADELWRIPLHLIPAVKARCGMYTSHCWSEFFFCCAGLIQRLGANRQTKLDIGLNLACMKRPIEQTKFHSSFLKNRMKVQTMIAAIIIMLVSAALPLYQIRSTASILLVFFCLILPKIVCLLADTTDAVDPRTPPEGFINQIFLGCHDIGNITEGSGIKRFRIDMHMDPAASVRQGTVFFQLSDDFLNRHNILIATDGTYHLRLIFSPCIDLSPIRFFFLRCYTPCHS